MDHADHGASESHDCLWCSNALVLRGRTGVDNENPSGLQAVPGQTVQNRRSALMTTTKHDELGCYGDGAFGHQHTRERCADVLEYYANENFTSRGKPVPETRFGTVAELVSTLKGEMSDDASEEDEACDWLNEHAPFTDAFWSWQDSDFGLWSIDEEE